MMVRMVSNRHRILQAKGKPGRYRFGPPAKWYNEDMVEQHERVIQRISSVLRTTYEPERIILFGSHATGDAGKDSDIDLLIVKETSQPFHQRLARVRQLVSSYREGLPFDLIVVTPAELNKRLALGDKFLSSILQSGKILYAREAS